MFFAMTTYVFDLAGHNIQSEETICPLAVHITVISETRLSRQSIAVILTAWSMLHLINLKWNGT